MEKYLVFRPDGSIGVIEIERADMLDEFYKAIDCDTLENVRTIISGVCLIVDESGKVKDPQQPFNELASRLHLGWLHGNDPIAGPAILASIGMVAGERDWVPLNEKQLLLLRKLGFKIPEDL